MSCSPPATAPRENGPFDMLVNTVGGRRPNVATEDMPLSQWNELVDLNLTSAMVCRKVIGGGYRCR
jgi:NAD(P)-dependent dehydrogenase (short-subunit alcohol dehydrogenase family)